MGVQMSRGSLSIPRQRDIIALILGCLKLSDGFCTGSHYISIARPWIYMKDETLLASTMIMSSEESGTSPSSSSLDVPMTVIDEKGRSQNNRVRRKYESFSWKNGYNINYRVEGPGDGKPILLVHGFGANVNHFRFQFPALVKEGYRVYAIDLLGFGASDKPPGELYCIELWGDLIVEFIRFIGGSSWVVAGNSIGGLCSLYASEKLAKQVRGCVLFNCAGGMTGFRYEELPWYLRPMLFFMQNFLFKGSIGRTFFQKFKTRENVESILKQSGVYRDITNVDEYLLETLLGPSDDEGAKDVFLKVFGGPAGPTPESILPNVKCSILALWGDNDPWTPVDSGNHPGSKFGAYSNRFSLVVIPNTGHCPHDERPGECHQTLLPWLKGLGE